MSLITMMSVCRLCPAIPAPTPGVFEPNPWYEYQKYRGVGGGTHDGTQKVQYRYSSQYRPVWRAGDACVPGFGCGLARESVGGVGFEVGL